MIAAIKRETARYNRNRAPAADVLAFTKGMTLTAFGNFGKAFENLGAAFDEEKKEDARGV